MGIRLKKLAAVALAAVLAFSVAPVTTVKAAEAKPVQTWVSQGNGWHYLQGTDVKVQIANDTITFTGTGAIPDFDYWRLYERPWEKSGCHYVSIAPTITSIGEYAFYEVDTIKHVQMHTTTFIENTNCFEGISYMPIFRIYGKAEKTRMYGTIPYTSLDSIKAFAQVNSMGAAYILDDNKSALQFQESVNPTICNVFHAKDEKAPWNALADNSNGNVITPSCWLAASNPDPSINVSAQRKFPGKACYEAFAAFIGNYTYATAFNVVAQKEQKIIKQTDNVLQYTLVIPPQYRQAGRSFRLLAIGEGTVHIYDDLDTANDTITFATDKPSTTYAVVYR